MPALARRPRRGAVAVTPLDDPEGLGGDAPGGAAVRAAPGGGKRGRPSGPPAPRVATRHPQDEVDWMEAFASAPPLGRGETHVYVH